MKIVREERTSQWAKKREVPNHYHTASRSRSRGLRKSDTQNKSQPLVEPLTSSSLRRSAIRTPSSPDRRTSSRCRTMSSAPSVSIWSKTSSRSSPPPCIISQSIHQNGRKEIRAFSCFDFLYFLVKQTSRHWIWEKRIEMRVWRTIGCGWAPACSRAAWVAGHRDCWLRRREGSRSLLRHLGIQCRSPFLPSCNSTLQQRVYFEVCVY